MMALGAGVGSALAGSSKEFHPDQFNPYADRRAAPRKVDMQADIHCLKLMLPEGHPLRTEYERTLGDRLNQLNP